MEDSGEERGREPGSSVIRVTVRLTINRPFEVIPLQFSIVCKNRDKKSV